MERTKEMQLEQVAEKALQNARQLKLAPPIFELYASLVALSLAMIMFLVPGLLEMEGSLYIYLSALATQEVWAGAFFTAGMLSALGMLFSRVWVRIVALVMLTLLYGTITVFYGLILPNFGFIVMVWVTVFTIASMPLVKYTGIWNNIQGGNNNDTEDN